MTAELVCPIGLNPAFFTGGWRCPFIISTSDVWLCLDDNEVWESRLERPDIWDSLLDLTFGISCDQKNLSEVDFECMVLPLHLHDGH